MAQDYPGAGPEPSPTRRWRRWTDEDQRRAELLREAGASFAAIGRELGRSGVVVKLHLSPEAKEKAKQRSDSYREQNREKLMEASAAWREKHPEKIKEGSRSYYEKNKESIKAKSSDYYWRNTDEKKLHQRAYYQRTKNCSNRRACIRAWVERNAEKIRAQAKVWREQNQEKIKSGMAKWREGNREKLNEISRRRGAWKRASRRVALVPLTLPIKIAIFADFNNCCAYCGARVRLTVDHVLALSKGGLDEASNVVPACKFCNSSKCARQVEAWYHKQPFFTEERWLKIQQQCPRATSPAP